MAILLKSLTVHQFREVAPGTTIRFRDTFNILLGKNATGKTTLLNLIASACSLNFSAFARERFAISFKLAGDGESTLDVELANVGQEPVPSVTAVEPTIPQRLAQDILTPHLTLKVTANEQVRLKAVVTDGKVSLELNGKRDETERTVGVPVFGSNLLLCALFSNPQRPEKLMQGAANALSPYWATENILRLDESLEYFERVVTGDVAALRVMAQKKGEVHVYPNMAPAELAAAAAVSLRRDPETATLHVRDVPLLRTLAQEMGFRSANMYAQRAEKTADSAGPWQAAFTNFRFEFTRHDGSTVDHRQLSYGQKRLVAFYYWLATYPGIVIADELVNGLHHAWIDHCIAAIEGRQAFLTTQNPLLLDYLPFDSEGEVAESFVMCKSALEAGVERIHWTNIGEKDSAGFYRAYKAGIQHVSEILATRALW